MDEERFDQLYNRILDGENWDYSTLDELICLSESGAREKGQQEIREKAIEAHIATCLFREKDKKGYCYNGIKCDRNCDVVREFIEIIQP